MNVIPVAAGYFPAAPGGRPGFWAATGRSGGRSASPFDSLNVALHVGDDAEVVSANRQAVAELVGLTGADVAALNAEHGGEVAIVSRPGVLPFGDGVVTTSVDLGLMTLAADCVPIVFASTSGVPVIGAAHCGWKGLGTGIVEATVHAMRKLGGESLSAVVGPSICAHCYPVSAERIEEVRQGVSAEVFLAATKIPGSLGVAAAAIVQCEELGVEVKQCPGCTAEDSTFFSFRRDGRTGRQCMIIRL